MASVVADVFGHLLEGLLEIDNPAVSVPPVDEIIDYTVLVAFTNQIIRDNNFLVVNGEFFEWNNFISRRFNDLVTSNRVNIWGKVLQKCLIFVLVQVFRKEIHLVKLQQLGCSSCPACISASGKHQQACWGGLACSQLWQKSLDRNLEFSFSLYISPKLPCQWKSGDNRRKKKLSSKNKSNGCRSFCIQVDSHT